MKFPTSGVNGAKLSDFICTWRLYLHDLYTSDVIDAKQNTFICYSDEVYQYYPGINL
jgi:hypothetical protein